MAGHLWLLIKGLNKAQGSLQFPEEYSHTTVLQEQFRFYGLIIKSLNVVLYHWLTKETNKNQFLGPPLSGCDVSGLNLNSGSPQRLFPGKAEIHGLPWFVLSYSGSRGKWGHEGKCDLSKFKLLHTFNGHEATVPSWQMQSSTETPPQRWLCQWCYSRAPLFMLLRQICFYILSISCLRPHQHLTAAWPLMATSISSVCSHGYFQHTATSSPIFSRESHLWAKMIMALMALGTTPSWSVPQK